MKAKDICWWDGRSLEDLIRDTDDLKELHTNALLMNLDCVEDIIQLNCAEVTVEYSLHYNHTHILKLTVDFSIFDTREVICFPDSGNDIEVYGDSTGFTHKHIGGWMAGLFARGIKFMSKEPFSGLTIDYIPFYCIEDTHCYFRNCHIYNTYASCGNRFKVELRSITMFKTLFTNFINAGNSISPVMADYDLCLSTGAVVRAEMNELEELVTTLHDLQNYIDIELTIHMRPSRCSIFEVFYKLEGMFLSGTLHLKLSTKELYYNSVDALRLLTEVERLKAIGISVSVDSYWI